jgi:hypothetical protein
MFYNYFFYVVFEWRGWTFFSVVNLAIGVQCAAASHAEFKCTAHSAALKPFCGSVVVIGMGLSLCNFIMADGDDLVVAWLRTMTLSFAWSWWFHFRVHPVDWEGVIEGEKLAEAQRVIKAKTEGKLASSAASGSDKAEKKSSSVGVYLQAMGGTTKSSGVFSFLLSVFFMGRVQHILESTMSYASVTSDMWAGLDEWKKADNGTGGSRLLCVVLVSFSTLQFTGTLARLIVPHKHRSINFFRAVLALTTVSEVPMCILIFFESGSEMKWVSVLFSCGSITVQLVNLMVASYLMHLKNKPPPPPPDESTFPATHLRMATVAKVAPKSVDSSADQFDDDFDVNPKSDATPPCGIEHVSKELPAALQISGSKRQVSQPNNAQCI